jgi:sporulation protein YlmC with PRC-barrel domain
MFRKDDVDGKIVIEVTGNAIGKAKDVAFGLDGTVALIVLASDNSEIQVTMDKVLGVGEYIVIRGDRPEPKVAPPAGRPVVPVTPAPVTAASPAGGACRSCGVVMKPGARFCTKCGTPA